jgi:multidrug efflux pump subunit AcrB
MELLTVFSKGDKMFKKIAIGFLLVVSLVVSGFVFEDRYNNQDDHDKDKVNERELNDAKNYKMGMQVAMNLKEMQTQQQISNKQNDYRYYSGVLRDVERKIEEIQRKLNANPNNQNARNDLQYYKQRKVEVRAKLNALMGN